MVKPIICMFGIRTALLYSLVLWWSTPRSTFAKEVWVSIVWERVVFFDMDINTTGPHQAALTSCPVNTVGRLSVGKSRTRSKVVSMRLMQLMIIVQTHPARLPWSNFPEFEFHNYFLFCGNFFPWQVDECRWWFWENSEKSFSNLILYLRNYPRGGAHCQFCALHF